MADLDETADAVCQAHGAYYAYAMRRRVQNIFTHKDCTVVKGNPYLRTPCLRSFEWALARSCQVRNRSCPACKTEQTSRIPVYGHRQMASKIFSEKAIASPSVDAELCPGLAPQLDTAFYAACTSSLGLGSVPKCTKCERRARSDTTLLKSQKKRKENG